MVQNSIFFLEIRKRKRPENLMFFESHRRCPGRPSKSWWSSTSRGSVNGGQWCRSEKDGNGVDLIFETSGVVPSAVAARWGCFRHNQKVSLRTVVIGPVEIELILNLWGGGRR